MKTNISGIMLMISDYSTKVNALEKAIRNHIYNTSIQELSGNVTVMDDYKDFFDEELKEYQECLKKITMLKGILYQKNNELTLSSGITIQEAIVKNANARKLKATYDYLISYKNTKTRETEVNNSYFECKSVNYNEEEIKREIVMLEEEIQNTDFEISKLNSIEFEIDL